MADADRDAGPTLGPIEVDSPTIVVRHDRVEIAGVIRSTEALEAFARRLFGVGDIVWPAPEPEPKPRKKRAPGTSGPRPIRNAKPGSAAARIVAAIGKNKAPDAEKIAADTGEKVSTVMLMLPRLRAGGLIP